MEAKDNPQQPIEKLRLKYSRRLIKNVTDIVSSQG